MNHIVEYISDRAGEDPFVLGDKKYQFVTALYPSGKKDIGVYVFGNDMVLDYEYWMDQNFISYEKGGKVKKNQRITKVVLTDFDEKGYYGQYKKVFSAFNSGNSLGFGEGVYELDSSGKKDSKGNYILLLSESIGGEEETRLSKIKGITYEEIDIDADMLEKGGSIEDLEKKNPTLKASREHEKRDKDFEIFEVSVEADAMMEAEGAEALEAIEIPAMGEIGADGAEAVFKKGGEINSDVDWKGIIKGVDGLKKLPNRLSHYFSSTSKSKRFPMAKLNPTKMTSREIASANKKMGAAYLGEGTKRAPITLRKVTDSKGRVSYDILDGNATFANAFFSGWKSIIGEIVDSVKETKQPSLAVLAQQIRKKGESLSDARKRAEMRLKKYKDGGDIEVSIVNEGVVFNKDKYPSIFGDSDKDNIPNVDDPNPQKAGDKKSIEQVKLSDVFERLLNVKEGLDVRMKKVVQSMKEKAPSGSKISARTKTPYSIVNKLVNKRLGTLTDMIGTTIIVDNQQDLESLKDRVERGEFGQVLDFDNYYENPKAGYRAYHFIVDAEGVPTEVQLKTNRQKALNQISHEPYKKEKLNAERLNELSLLAMRADMAEETAVNEFDMLMKYPKAVEKQLTLG